MKISQYDQAILNYCISHADDSDCQYILESYAESAAKKKAENKRWKRIAEELEQYGERKRDD